MSEKEVAYERGDVRVLLHVALPALAPAVIVGLYLTPLTVIDCVTRGLLAAGVTFASAAVAFTAIALSVRAQRHGDASAHWWLATAAILTIPLALLLGPLG